ncbi:MAG: hypothetical protein MZV70_13350 [Desulfobacterales bacterium]|nr:hypothetical protein [Desulfobacterales bacterium]
MAVAGSMTERTCGKKKGELVSDSEGTVKSDGQPDDARGQEKNCNEEKED